MSEVVEFTEWNVEGNGKGWDTNRMVKDVIDGDVEMMVK